jgi:transcriptional regulator with XRE-family HTH domain
MSLPTRPQVAEAFGATLRLVRKERRLSQERVAEGADMDRTYPSLLERSTRSPTLGMVVALAHALRRQDARSIRGHRRPSKSVHNVIHERPLYGTHHSASKMPSATHSIGKL